MNGVSTIDLETLWPASLSRLCAGVRSDKIDCRSALGRGQRHKRRHGRFADQIWLAEHNSPFSISKHELSELEITQHNSLSKKTLATASSALMDSLHTCSWHVFTTSHIWRKSRRASFSRKRLRTRTCEWRSPCEVKRGSGGRWAIRLDYDDVPALTCEGSKKR